MNIIQLLKLVNEKGFDYQLRFDANPGGIVNISVYNHADKLQKVVGITIADAQMVTQQAFDAEIKEIITDLYVMKEEDIQTGPVGMKIAE